MQNLNEVLNKFLNEEPIIIYKTIYTEMFGSIGAGLLVASLIYWSKTMKHGQFYKTDKDLCQETGMKIDQLRAAKKQILDTGVFSIEVKSLPARTYYQINLSGLINLLTKYKSLEDKPVKELSHKTKNQYRENPQTGYGIDPNQYRENPHTTSETKASIKTETNTITNHAREAEPKKEVVEQQKAKPSIDLTADSVSDKPVDIQSFECENPESNEPTQDTIPAQPEEPLPHTESSHQDIAPHEIAEYQPKPKTERTISVAAQNFLLFWAAYPQKVGKGAAAKAFERAIKKTSLQAMLRALEAQKLERETCARLGVWTPSWAHPSTWLNQDRWENVCRTEEELRQEAQEKWKQRMSYRDVRNLEGDMHTASVFNRIAARMEAKRNTIAGEII